MNQVLSASASGHNLIDAMKYWTSLLNLDANPIAVLAIEVISIPVTSAPVERIFSQAGMATATHRNKASFELLNAQLVVYCNRFCDVV
uniref:HAT C-terminal dimerisation domain-containing protein n=1 Tax=Ditylenchus dipsaci TaxID=166011 RepID=A0A915DPU2_9BILA